jgi:hypothetical protein
MTPREELLAVLGELDASEVPDVLAHAKRILATRDAAVDPELTTQIMATLERYREVFRKEPGVPLSILRAGLVQPRRILDRALYEAEDSGLLSLVAIKRRMGFVDQSAGIQDRTRGLLYYCAPPVARAHDRGGR